MSSVRAINFADLNQNARRATICYYFIQKRSNFESNNFSRLALSTLRFTSLEILDFSLRFKAKRYTLTPDDSQFARNFSSSSRAIRGHRINAWSRRMPDYFRWYEGEDYNGFEGVEERMEDMEVVVVVEANAVDILERWCSWKATSEPGYSQ